MSHPATTPLQILVEHCTAERDEGLRPSLSLKGDKAVYVAKLDELEQLLALELPGVPVAANSDHLFQLHDEQEQRSLGRDYHQPLRAKRRGPRLGSFEVFVELSFWDGLKGNQVAVLAPITSKLRSKKFPDLRRVFQLILSTVVDNLQRLALKSINSQQHGFTNQLVHSVLQYTFTQEIGQEAAQPPSAQGVDEWAAALQIETFEAASVRELDMLPRLLLRSKSWRLLHNVVCSLHFLAAKLAKCGVNAVVGDLQATQALIKQSTSASHQDSDHGVESKHLSTAAASLQRQLHSDVDTCLRFITKNTSALLANPACIYARAQAYSLPALTTLKQRFVAVLQRLQMLAQNTDAEERESTGVELLQLSYGLTLMRWAERSRFLDAFSETDKRWMGYCQQDFQARITVRRQWIREMLDSEADGARALFEEQADDEVLGHLSGARRLMMLARSLTTKPFDCTMRLEYCSQEPISAQEGFERVQTVLRELLVDQGIVSVEADVVRESEQLTMASEDLFVYCVTVGLRMTPGAHAQGETLPNARLESVESFVRSVLEDQGPELKAMLPNRTTLRYIGRERDAFLVLKMCLPTSMPCSDNDMHRYKELLRDDLVASSGYELETQCIEVLQLSRWGALVVVREALLPPRVSTVDIAKDWMQQLEATAAMMTPELLRGERLISLHVSWISCHFSKPPDRAWGQDDRALLYVLAESSDLEAERGILSGLVFPALAMECRFRDVHLDCLLFDGSAQSQQRGHGEGASKSQSLVNRTRLLRNHLAERQDGSTVVKLGVVGRVQRIEAEIDAEVLRQDSENNWGWVSAPPFASMSTPLLHVYTDLSLHGAGDRQAAASAAAKGIRRALSARKISFKANSAQLDDGGQEVLALVSSALKGLGTMGVDVHGHCESASDGMALSQARAQAVVDWLTASGCKNAFRVHAHAHEHPDVGAQMMVRIIPAPGVHTLDVPGDGEEEDASVPRQGGEAVFAMVRRQEFGEHDDAGEFIKQVPAKLRAAFKPVPETQAAVQHVISRVYEKLGPERASEYRVGFNAYGPGDAAGCRRVGASKSVQQTGIEAFALRAYEHAATSIMAAKAPVVCRRPYPWQLRELERQQCVQQRHQEVFFAEPGGQLQAAVEELVSIATSMDMTAPTLVLVDGVSGSGRSALLAQVSSSLAPPASKRYLVHYNKPQGTTLGQALPAIVSQLLLQLVGGKHLHVQTHKFKWTLSELFDVVQRCSAQSCHDASSTYRRVVLIFDGFDDAEQLDICEHLLARPRLFPLVTCIVATNSAHNDSGVTQHEEEGLVVLNRRRMIKSHLHSRVVAMPRLSEAEALQVATNMLTHTHQDPEAVMHICRQHLVRKREIWRPGYIRCLVQTIRCTSGALWTQALDAMPPTRALAFDRLLDALSEMYGALSVGALLCSLLSAPGSLDSELCMRHCKPNATLSHEHFASIMQLLQAYMVEEEMWRDRTLMLAQDCWPVIIAKFVIPQLDCLDQRALDMLAQQSVASLCRTRAHAQLPPHAQHVGAGESNGAARAGLAVQLPENLGVRLTSYWARLEEEAFVDDRRRFTVWQKQKSSSKLGHGRTANSSGLNSSMSLPSGLGGGDAGGRSATLEDSAQALSYLHDMRGQDRDEQIISKMMEEMMLTSQKAFSVYALDNVESSPGSSMSRGSRDLLQGVRPSSAIPYRDSPEVPRRPKSAGPVLRMRKSGFGYAGALMGGWEGEESDALDNTVEETARPFLKLRSSPMRPQRLEENWIELDLQAFPIQRSPMFGKHRARRSSTSMSPAPNKPSFEPSKYTRDRGGEVGYALANAREADALPGEVRRERLSNNTAAAEGLADMAQELLEEEEAELFLTDSPSRPQSAASHLGHGSADGGVSRGRMVRPVSASPSMWARGTVGKRRDTWQVEQAMRWTKQEERGRQLAQACEVRKRMQLAWEQRHAHLAQQNALIREKQERVHARERKPFVVCDEGLWQYRGTGSSAARRGGLFDLERAGRIMRTHDGQAGRILYEGLEVREEVMQERKLMRQKINRKAKQRKQDLEDYITHVSNTRSAPDYDADRREFEKLVREAIESREIFDLLFVEKEAAKADAQRQQELQELREQRCQRSEEAAAEELKKREQVHQERLRANFGMTLIEQVGAVENMRDYGIRILRPSQPTTVLIGSRRSKVKVPRLLKTLRGEAFPRIADTKVMRFFTVQVIPAEGQCKFIESADSFAGAYRLRIRYSDVRQVAAKKRKGDDNDEDYVDEGSAWTGPMRIKPIILRISGSDGYLGVWTEKKVPADQAALQNNVLCPYRGVLETDPVPPAEDGVGDLIDIRGVDPSESAVPVQDKFDFEFVKRLPGS